MTKKQETPQDLTDIKLQMFRDFNAILDKVDAMQEAGPVDVDTFLNGPQDKQDDAPATPEDVASEVDRAFEEALPTMPPLTPLDHDHNADMQHVYAAPDSNDSGILKALRAKFSDGLKPGLQMFKGIDGKRYMLIGTSNSYKDREGETITTDALKSDVDRHWTDGDGEFMSNNPLLFWHDDRLNIGDIVWGDVRGPMYVELAREGETPLAHKMWDAIEKSGEKWGASHRFAYFTQDRNSDGDYRRIYKQETSILPRDAAANLLTFGEVLPVSKNRNEYLAKMTGLANAGALLDESIEKFTEAMSAQGLEHKAVEDGSATVGLSPAVAQGFVDMAEDMASLDERVEKAVTGLETATKSVDDKGAALDKALADVKAIGEKLQARLDARPTRASQSKDTEIEDGELADEVSDLLMVEHPVFGKVHPKTGATS